LLLITCLAGTVSDQTKLDFTMNQNHSAIPVDLSGQKWARLEVWDISANGAFTQPVWIE